MDKVPILFAFLQHAWVSITYNLSRWAKTLHLDEVLYFFYFLIHRYQATQIDLRHRTHNVNTLIKSTWLTSNRKGRLRALETPWERFWFRVRNVLLLGAPMSRCRKVVYLTFVSITLELNNPFTKRVLTHFLSKKLTLFSRLLKRLETLNGRPFDQTLIKEHIDTFQRSSLLQCTIIEHMHKAVARQQEPQIIKEAKGALAKGLYPILITQGLSGAYWMRGPDREVLGLFKPFDEEIHAPNNPIGPRMQGALGLRRTRPGCRVGEAAHHEVAAFLVDAYFGFGIVPHTTYASFTHRSFFQAREDRIAAHPKPKTKYGSFQEYVGGFVPLIDILRQEKEELPLIEYQLLIVLDVIIGNSDRHAGNILVGDEKLAAIDHGLSFPDTPTEISTWYWDLKQGSEPLFPALVELLTNFPFDELFWKLKKNCFISEATFARLRERVVLFTEGIKAGLAPKELAGLMKFEYLIPLLEHKKNLPTVAREQVEIFRSKL